MKNVTAIIIGLIMSLLTACSSVSQPTNELEALALPGAPTNSWSNGHIFGYTGPGIPNGHRATVVAKRSTKLWTYSYNPDSYIPVSARFAVDLGGDHVRSNIRGRVSPSSIWNPIYCTWNLYSYRALTCSGSFSLSYGTLYTVTLEEYNPGNGQWAVITKAYFRTQAQVFQP
jgi:hypothetical protein